MTLITAESIERLTRTSDHPNHAPHLVKADRVKMRADTSSGFRFARYVGETNINPETHRPRYLVASGWIVASWDDVFWIDEPEIEEVRRYRRIGQAFYTPRGDASEIKDFWQRERAGTMTLGQWPLGLNQHGWQSRDKLELVYPVKPIIAGLRMILARRGEWVVQKCQQIGQWLNRESFEIRHFPTDTRLGPAYFSPTIAVNALVMADFWLNTLDMSEYALPASHFHYIGYPEANPDKARLGMPDQAIKHFWGDLDHFLNAEHLNYCEKYPELATF